MNELFKYLIDGIFNYINSNALSALKIFIIIYAFFVIAIKFIAFIVKRKKQTFKPEEDIILTETKKQKQESTTVYLLAVNFSVIIILCLCAVVFSLVQIGYNGDNICQYNLTKYWNILVAYLLSISFIAPDIDDLFNTNFANSIIFTRWFKSFEFIVLTLYLPIIISLIIICR